MLFNLCLICSSLSFVYNVLTYPMHNTSRYLTFVLMKFVGALKLVLLSKTELKWNFRSYNLSCNSSIKSVNFPRQHIVDVPSSVRLYLLTSNYNSFTGSYFKGQLYIVLVIFYTLVSKVYFTSVFIKMY